MFNPDKYQGSVMGVMFWLSCFAGMLFIVPLLQGEVVIAILWFMWSLLWCALWLMGELSSKKKWQHRRKLENLLEQQLETNKGKTQ